MEFVWFWVHVSHFLLRDFPARWILPTIQPTSDGQPFGRGRSGNQVHDRLVISQRLTPPVRRNEREEPVLDLVPLAGARWKVADGKRQAAFIRETLQLQFPESQPPTVAAPAIGGDQQCPGARIKFLPLGAPPATNRGHGKGSRVMVGDRKSTRLNSSHLVISYAVFCLTKK